MKFTKLLSRLALFSLSLVLVISCNSTNESPNSQGNTDEQATGKPVVLGYSNWAGWWPWAIAEKEGLFEQNGANVKLQWFDGYTSSMEALAAGKIDANCQTLNDTVSFAPEAVNGEVAVLVNDNSAGNDKIIATEEIQSIPELKGQDVAVEVGVVDDFLLSLALEEEGMSRSDVNIVDLETGAAAAAFVSKKVDAVGAFPPFWLTALEREGSHELISSAAFPGAIPDLLVTTQTLIDERPEQVQALVNTWFDILEFMDNNPERADEIMAERANVTTEKLQLFKEGTDMFTLEENLTAFSDGNSMKHMPYAAQEMADFMVNVGFIPQKSDDLSSIFNDSFVKTYAEKQE
ncbi:MAG: aliphatic sulfonates ABC transporter substrate-binding protein [Cyanobacteria bacterium SW_9_44_58]|nr:MAG: aliphatic sulfonates ABC transporter substrate-binding protein [Cyanobacteria bacterium SW_9_44_58]